MNQTKSSYPVINFMKYKGFYFAISLMVILPGLYYLLSSGLSPAIDFTGGSLLELQLDPSINKSDSEIRSLANSLNINISSLQHSDNNLIVLKTQPITKDQSLLLQEAIASSSGLANATDSAFLATSGGFLVQENQFATVGPTLGSELLKKTMYSVLLATIAILLYVAWRFKNVKFGVTAVMAMLHDTLILLGVFAILGHFFEIQVDTLFVTAVLTTLSFSVHDTIVVYDRIRESTKQYPKANFTDLVNKAIAETLSRSINNSMTIIFMLLSLFLMGGLTTRWFVFALLIGTIAGTYSSTFTAAPLLDLWNTLEQKRKSKPGK
jgi:preprotein translocase subunit SecF